MIPVSIIRLIKITPRREAYGLALSLIAASNRGFQKAEELRDQGIGIVFSPGCGDRPFGCAVSNSVTPDPFKTVVGKGFGNHRNAKAGADQGQHRGDFGDFLNHPGTKAVSGTQLQSVPVEGGTSLRRNEDEGLILELCQGQAGGESLGETVEAKG